MRTDGIIRSSCFLNLEGDSYARNRFFGVESSLCFGGGYLDGKLVHTKAGGCIRTGSDRRDCTTQHVRGNE